MIVGVADTHTAIWYVYNDARLSRLATRFFEQAVSENHQIGVSSITFAEIVYLEEKGRVTAGTLAGLAEALERPDSVLIGVDVTRAIAEAMRHVARAQVPDLPDRVIAATAWYLGVPLISRDSRIRASGVTTIW